MPTGLCLYCSEEKPIAGFNREHVVPQSFGRFEHSHVLHECVCADCNSYFSKHLELTLARETFEGLTRFHVGIARPKARANVGEGLMELRHRGGLQDGALLQVDTAAGGVLRPRKQLGFSRDEAGPFSWYPVEKLPTKEQLVASGYDLSALHVQSGGLSNEEVSQHLAGMGLDLLRIEELAETLNEDGTIPVQIKGKTTEVVLRAFAKICLNYLAFNYPAIARMDHFKTARAFVRFGSPLQSISVVCEPGAPIGGVPTSSQVLAHTVAVEWNARSHTVVGTVSLFSHVTYKVTLSDGAFLIPPETVSSGHLYDPINRQIHALSRRRPSSGEVPMVSWEEHRRKAP